MASPMPLRVFTRSLHHLPRRRIALPARWVGARRTAATYTSPRQASQISIIQSAVDTDGERYRDNAGSMGELTTRLVDLHAKAALGGSEKARQKHIDRGKMLVRDRITALIDPGTSFLELSALAGHEMYPGEDVPGGGVVAGIGTVEGVMCMIIGNDSTYGRTLPFENIGNRLTILQSQRWDILPHKHQKARQSTRDRPAKSITLHLPRRLWWRQPPLPKGRLPRQRPLRPWLLQPSTDEQSRHPANQRSNGSLHRRRRLRPQHERRKHHRS